MDVFSAFPNAIISDQYELGEMVREVGAKVFKSVAPLDVIVDEGTYAGLDVTPKPEDLENDTLFYAKPSQLPTLVTQQLTNGYLIHDTLNGFYYEIREASLGKNQDAGEVEHVELLVRQTEVLA